MARLVSWLYRLLGRRYPRVMLWAGHLMSFPVILGGVGLLTLYQPLGGDLWQILAFVFGLMLVENAFSYRLVSRLVRPADPWLGGDRSPAAVAAAWRAIAGLPRRYTKSIKYFPVFFNLLPASAFMTYVLELPFYSVAFLVAGGLVVLGYGAFLRFFLVEFALRPVLVDISRELPPDFELGDEGVSLRARLMLALPLLSLITGVIVAGLSTTSRATLADLGLDVAVAVAVAFTLSLELTLLLSRSIVGPMDELREATERVGAGDLDVQVPVASTDEIGRLAQSFNQAVAGLRERATLHEAFGAYVDPSLAERVLAEGVALSGEEVEVSVLFVDIHGFTAFSERSSAAEVVAVLNGFFEEIVPVLVRHGGHANKFVGDGLLGVFGAPEKLADHADRAVAAALEIASVVRARSDSLRVGIGVNSGPVVAGTIGGGGRVEFTVIGDPVNTAARVEEATRVSGDDVLITAGTRALLTRDHDNWEQRPAIPLKGKSETVTLFAPAFVPTDGAANLSSPECDASPLPPPSSQVF